MKKMKKNPPTHSPVLSQRGDEFGLLLLPRLGGLRAPVLSDGLRGEVQLEDSLVVARGVVAGVALGRGARREADASRAADTAGAHEARHAREVRGHWAHRRSRTLAKQKK